MDSVIIPAFNRPEFLYLCLEHIKEAEQAETKTYLFTFDFGFDKRLYDVIKDFPFTNYVIEKQYNGNKITKQSANVLNGLIAGAMISDNVHLIEDDVFIAKDYFKFQDFAMSLNPFCSIASINFNKRKDFGDIDKYYIDRGTYQSIGVCFKSSTILTLIKPHYNDSYLINPRQYCLENFKSSLGVDMVEQDGLIHRISERENAAIIFPEYPRCFHAGLYGKNRGTYLNKKTVAEKVEFLRKTVYDVNTLKNHVHNENYIYDSMPINLQTNENNWTQRKEL